MDRHIALDGPLNGQYIDAGLAAIHNYTLEDWAPGEDAYFHSNTPLALYPRAIEIAPAAVESYWTAVHG